MDTEKMKQDLGGGNVFEIGGPILLVTGGRGYYQEWGKEARELKAGETTETFQNQNSL